MCNQTLRNFVFRLIRLDERRNNSLLLNRKLIFDRREWTNPPVLNYFEIGYSFYPEVRKREKRQIQFAEIYPDIEKSLHC